MRRHHLPEIVGIVLVALVLPGCGEDPATTEGTMPWKGTNTSSLEPLRNEMQKNMRSKVYLKKIEESGQPSVATQGTAESQPVAESKPATPAPPARGSTPAPPATAAEWKPGAESKSVTKGG
jgi:hypothetical protein